MDIDELKQEAETETTEEVANEVQAESESTNEEAQEAVEAEQEAEDKTEEVDQEWMKESEKKFTDHDVAAAKRKLKGKLSESNDKIAELEAKIASIQQPQAPQGKPTREQYYSADDPEDAYIEALTDWKINNKTQTINQEQQQQQYKNELNNAVTEHYSRAESLIEKSNISPEVYQQSDTSVRQMIDGIHRGQGNMIVDNLISVLGEGSEKVLFYVGRNSKAMAELQASLITDPSGLKAVSYLSRKAAMLDAPTKRETNAPPPAKQVTGDEATGNVRSFKKAYDKAKKSGDAQEAFNARREARQAGVDVGKW